MTARKKRPNTAHVAGGKTGLSIPNGYVYRAGANGTHYVQSTPVDNDNVDRILLTAWSNDDLAKVIAFLQLWGDRSPSDASYLTVQNRADLQAIKESMYRLMASQEISFLQQPEQTSSTGYDYATVLPDAIVPGQFDVTLFIRPAIVGSGKTIVLAINGTTTLAPGTPAYGDIDHTAETSTTVTYYLQFGIPAGVAGSSGSVTWINPTNSPAVSDTPTSLSINISTGQLDIVPGQWQKVQTDPINSFDNSYSAPALQLSSNRKTYTLVQPYPTSPPPPPPPVFPPGTTVLQGQCNVATSCATFLIGECLSALTSASSSGTQAQMLAALGEILLPFDIEIAFLNSIAGYIYSTGLANVASGLDDTIKAFILCDLYSQMQITGDQSITPALLLQWAADIETYADGVGTHSDATFFVAQTLYGLTHSGVYSYRFQQQAALYSGTAANCSTCPPPAVTNSWLFQLGEQGWSQGFSDQILTDLPDGNYPNGVFYYNGGHFIAGDGWLSTQNYPATNAGWTILVASNVLDVLSMYIDNINSGSGAPGRYVTIRNVPSVQGDADEMFLYVTTLANTLWRRVETFKVFPNPASPRDYTDLTFDIGAEDAIVGMQIIAESGHQVTTSGVVNIISVTVSATHP
jgi:hypothetical protein